MIVAMRCWVMGVALGVAPHGLAAQDSIPADTAIPRHAGHFHVGLTIHEVGISFGNASRVTGIRINVQDADLERVTGVNLTFWKPREPFGGTINGLQVGVLPGSADVNGAAVGLAGPFRILPILNVHL